MLVFSDHPVIDELKGIDIDNITPRQALEILYRIKEKLYE